MKPFAPKNDFIKASAKTLDSLYDKVQQLESFRLEDLNPAETMVVVIDMNKGFAVEGALYSERVKDLIAPIAGFVEACIAKHIHILAFSDRHSPGSPEIESYPAHCMEDTPECELVDELSRLRPLTIYKNSTNAFFSGKEQLLKEPIKDYIVTGCCTDICIYQFATALRAWLNENNLPGRVIVPLSLVETYDAPWHNAELLSAVFIDSMLSNGILVVKEIIH